MKNLERTSLERCVAIGCALLFFSAVGCGSEDTLGPSGPWLPDTGVSVAPAQPGDASNSGPLPATAEAGTSTPPSTDAGQLPSTSDAARPSATDASMDAGMLAEAGSTPPDASLGDASSSDASSSDASSSDASTSDASTSDASAGDASTPRADLGKGDGSDVIMIGDSWMSNTLQLLGTGGGIAPSLVSASRQRYRNYAVQGVMLLTSSLFGPAIPTQWTDAVRANRNIKTVVMTAGGNDIIQDSRLNSDCAQGGNLCKMKLEEIGRALADLWAKMSAAGVADVVHVLYASSAGSGLKDPEANNRSLQSLCSAVPAPMRCHLLKTDELVRGELAIDGIHPTRAANDRMAKAIMDLMAAEGMRR